MRRTLTVLVTAGAFLVPAGAASAAVTHENASCSNAKGGNYVWSGHTYNGLGNATRAGSVAPACVTPSSGEGTDGVTPAPTVEVPGKGSAKWEAKHGGSQELPGGGGQEPEVH